MSGFKMAVENDQPVVKDIQPFSQIASMACPMVYASLEAYAITGDTTYAKTAGKLGTWLLAAIRQIKPSMIPPTAVLLTALVRPPK
ncbi:MAG: hypothetical protein R2788_09825 [Saprospiraceae bacterium]